MTALSSPSLMAAGVERMQPVYQTTFGGEGAPLNEKGNCFSACLATLLELPLEEVPNFHVLMVERDRGWSEVVTEWLAEHGLWVFGALWNEGWNEEAERLKWGPYLLTGQSPRGFWRHTVVAEEGGIVHDPAGAQFPDGPRLEPPNEAIPWEVEVLVPFDYKR